ncbi:hypothetical protein HHI36_009710 [Cryptolaemus montrouzieri]|uniref:Uncharacterized protein n=1 Tax=Cryptolaemus montrouzieri TaxID=559131 RepID=A0ABD2MGK1_9CUCU
MIDKAKSKVFQERMKSSSNRAKEIWKGVTFNLGRKNRTQNIQLLIDNQLQKDQTSVANTFGKYLPTIADKKLSSSRKQNSTDTTNAANISEQTMFLDDVIEEQFRVILKKLLSKSLQDLTKSPAAFSKV